MWVRCIFQKWKWKYTWPSSNQRWESALTLVSFRNEKSDKKKKPRQKEKKNNTKDRPVWKRSRFQPKISHTLEWSASMVNTNFLVDIKAPAVESLTAVQSLSLTRPSSMTSWKHRYAPAARSRAIQTLYESNFIILARAHWKETKMTVLLHLCFDSQGCPHTFLSAKIANCVFHSYLIAFDRPLFSDDTW